MKNRELFLVLAMAAGIAAWFLGRKAPASPASAAGAEETATASSTDLAARGTVSPAPRAGPRGAADSTRAGVPVLDRQKRDALRALIWQSLGEAPPDAGDPARPSYVLPDLPPWPDGPSDSGGGLEPKYIQQSVRSQFFPVAVQCYTDLQKRVPDAGGSAVLAFNIVGNQNVGGIVEQVDMLNKSTLRDPDFVDCMRQSFLSVTFPPPEGGGSVSVIYPIEFSPGDEADE